MFVEVVGRLCVAKVIVEDAVEEVGDMGMADRDTDSQGEVASI